ncbi:MAG: RNA polymerase sigma factor [Solirubrobacterales bacterium]
MSLMQAHGREREEDADTARLVARIQEGADEKFATLYERYFDRVYAYLRVLLRDSHEAEDATQQVFTQVLEALPRYEKREAPFRAWLFTIARNHGLRRLRQRRRVEPLEEEETIERRRPGEPEQELPALNWISDGDLMLFLERLPEPQRQVLMLRFMLDLSTDEIARVLERTPSDVRALQSRALRFLRQRLTALGRRSEFGGRARISRRFRQAPVLRLRRFALTARPNL